ncbi:MAG: Deoxyribodipyrimidine photolyase, partial [uncultured Solirubrobacteraceae bacterium]
AARARQRAHRPARPARGRARQARRRRRAVQRRRLPVRQGARRTDRQRHRGRGHLRDRPGRHRAAQGLQPVAASLVLAPTPPRPPGAEGDPIPRTGDGVRPLPRKSGEGSDPSPELGRGADKEPADRARGSGARPGARRAGRAGGARRVARRARRRVRREALAARAARELGRGDELSSLALLPLGLPVAARVRAAGARPRHRRREGVGAAARLARLPRAQPAPPPRERPPRAAGALPRPRVRRRARAARRVAGGPHRLPARRRGDARARRHRLHAQPRPAGLRLVPHEGAAPRLAPRRGPLRAPAAVRRAGAEQRQLAVDRRHRHRPRAVLPAHVQPGAAPAALRPRRHVRPALGARAARRPRRAPRRAVADARPPVLRDGVPRPDRRPQDRARAGGRALPRRHLRL